MDGQRKRSKGSFFNFFDWNGKSRKKLFAKEHDFTEGAEHRKENVECANVAKAESHGIELHERQANSSTKASSDFSCTSSVTSDDGFRTRAPGVVARLMGLNSLPTSSVTDPSPTPFSSSWESQYDGRTRNLWSECNPVEYVGISSNPEGVPRNSSESRSQKVQNRPIERFQTETLPPKSSKSMPTTHNKLLSPIRSPRFVPRKNTAYIMEAAAKIIEASPKSNMDGRVSISSPSVPLRIRDLKQKMEAAHTASRRQRSNEQIAATNRKGRVSDRWQSGSHGLSSSKASALTEKGTSECLRNKGKSVSLSGQVKSNVKRKEGAASRSMNSTKQKEIRPNPSLKNQPGTQNTKGTSNNRNNNILRQNYQKQNGQTGQESSTSKTSVRNQQGGKAQSIKGSVGHSRTMHKVALKSETMSKKTRSVQIDYEKDKPNGTTLKKRSVNGDPQIGRSVSIKCNIEVEGHITSEIDERKDGMGMDVVSFTFTSPVKRATPHPQPSTMGKSNSSFIDSFGSSHPCFSKSSSFHGLNIIGAGVLGALLEEKLRELTDKVKSSKCNIIRDDVSAHALPNFVSTFDAVDNIPVSRRSQFVMNKDDLNHLDEFDCLSTEDSSFVENQKWQGSADVEECSSSSYFSQAEKDQYQHPSPVSILEPSFENGSCSNTNADDVLSGLSATECLDVDCDTELSDSATSICAFDTGKKHLTGTFNTSELNDSPEWETDYVLVILDNAETMLKDFALGRTSNVVAPQLFHQLENQHNVVKQNKDEEEDYSKHERKVLFDCVSECLELRQTYAGSCKSWAKMRTVFERKEWLAGKLCKEILGWKNMGDLMVDELVDKDMSTRYGKWLDFDVEMFEEGVEIEKEILTCLVDEVVSDIFIL